VQRRSPGKAPEEVVDARKHAVVLSGGGANGAYEIGILKALLEGHSPATGGFAIEPEIFSGTSVGSYNAAYLVSRADSTGVNAVSELEKIWETRIAKIPTRASNGAYRLRANITELADLNVLLTEPLSVPSNLLADGAFFMQDWYSRMVHFFQSKEPVSRRVVKLVDFSTLFCVEPLQSLVRETIDLRKLRGNKKRSLIIAATDWENGQVRLFGHLAESAARRASEKMKTFNLLDDNTGHKAILASTAIPGIFPPVEIFNTLFVDGGILMNTPLSPAIYAGAEVVHAIYLNPNPEEMPVRENGRTGMNTMDTINRLVSLLFSTQVERNIAEIESINASLQLSEFVPSLLLGPQLVESASQTEPRSKRPLLEDFIPRKKQKKIAGKQQITVHKYHPRQDMGGVLGLLDFGADRIARLIDWGFRDAVTHDCEKNGCVLPARQENG
jgi:NTE family protein